MRKLFPLLFVLFAFTNLAKAEIPGCTDPLAENYNPLATVNDGSCRYPAAMAEPLRTWPLPASMDETSGLIIWNDKIWTHNDDHDINLYSFDTTDVNAYTAWPLTGTVNFDWEEISQDDTYIYVGDFGNNYTGNRTDLHILRIDKSSLLAGNPQIDSISFSYSLQTDFSSTGSNNTDFDCEAMIVSGDSIFLFTKEWVSQNTSIYSIPKEPGEYVAQFRGRYEVDGLITGSTWLEDKRLIVLSGYSLLLQPFFILLYDYYDNDFLSGNIRRIEMDLPFHQVEGITTVDGLHYFVSNEFISHSIVTIPQKLHFFNLSEYLEGYLESLENVDDATGYDILPHEGFTVYPNPVNKNQYIRVTGADFSADTNYRLINTQGQVIKQGLLTSEESRIHLNGIKPGVYFMALLNDPSSVRKLIVR